MSYEQARFNMVEQQIRPWQVLDQQVLDVILKTPREAFVPAEKRQLAYVDTAIALPHKQCMMPPVVEGRLLQALNLSAQDRVLEIGTGTGYLTACIAQLAAQVDSIDIYQDFIDDAGRNLGGLGLSNTQLRVADACQTFDQSKQYQAIVFTGALSTVPSDYKNALAIGGRLFIIVGQPNQPIMEALLITRTSQAQWMEESLFETHIPFLVNAALPGSFSF